MLRTLLVSVALTAFGNFAFAQRADFPFAVPYFEDVGDRDSIPSGVVTCMVTAPNGMIWLGTQTGLLRHDGYRFEHHQFDPSQPNSLPGNFISALAVAPDGKILIGTSNDGFSVYDPESLKFLNFSVSDGLSSDSIGAIAVSDESYWIGTNAGLTRYQPALQRFTQLPLPGATSPGSREQRVRALLLDTQGLLWVGTSEGLLQYRPESESFSAVSIEGVAQTPFAGQSINALFEDSERGLWVGTRENGVARISPQRDSLIRRDTAAADGSPGLATGRIQALAQPNAESVWVATTVGLHELGLQDLRVQAHWLSDKEVPGSLAFDAIGALVRDQGGLIWIGTWGGRVQRTNPENRGVRTIRRDAKGIAGLSHADVHAVLEQPDGTLWVGTGGNGIDLIDPQLGRIGGIRPGSESDKQLADGVVIALARAADGTVWAGTQRGGLFSISAQTRLVQRHGDEGTVSNLLYASDDTLWIGGSQGLQRLPQVSESRQTMLDTQGRPITGQIIPMIEDSAGRIWAASANGLRVLEPGSDAFLTIEHEPGRADSLVHNSVYGLLEDSQGRLWVATEQGIDRMLSRQGGVARFEHISADLGSPGRELGANLLEDDLGRIWTDTVVIDTERKRIDELNRANGFDVGTTWFGAYARLRDGRFLSGGTEGLLLIEPELVKVSAYHPPVVATELRVNGLTAALQPSSGIELTPDQRSFSIAFAALDFSAPESLRYRYQLEGFDGEWIDTDAAQRVASYSNLWPGQYELIVEGSNRSGILADQPLRIPVRVLPAIWQTLWFQLLVGAAVLALILLAMRWRTKRLQQRSTELDTLVSARTAQLESANVSLSQSNADLLLARQHLEQTQSQLVFQEKMASLGQLVAGVAHEVNTPLGIAITASSFLQQRNEDLQRDLVSASLTSRKLQDFAVDTAQSTKLLHDNLNRAAHLVKQFKQVSVDRHQDERRSVALDQFLEELLASLKPLFKDTTVALVFRGAPTTTIETHPGAIGQVITNLLQNALLHAFPDRRGGQVEVIAEIDADDESTVEIRVSDDGVGMDEVLQSHVFEPFFTTRRHQGGTGLGLHIVFNIVTSQLGGTIRLDSQPDVGSTFLLRFPAQAPRQVEKAATHQ